MVELFRDAPAGHLMRFLTGNDGELAFADNTERIVSGHSTPLRNNNGEVDKEATNTTPRIAEDIVDWYDENDRDNPQNWSLRKKVFVLVQIMLLNFSVYIGSSIVVPAQPKLVEIYGVSMQSAALSLSMYVLGYGIGPMFFSPISEMPRMGRNISYLSSLFLFVLMTVGASTVDSFAGFIVFRFLQGIFGGPVLATGGASAADLFNFLKAPYAIGSWAASGFAGPALGPLVAAFAVEKSTWRWPMYETLILNVFTFLLLFFCLPETNADTILLQRAQRLRKLTGNQKLRSNSEIRQGEMNFLATMGQYLTTPFKLTVLDPSIAFINIYTALTYAIYYSYFESFPFVYQGVYGFSTGEASIVFISILIAGIIGAIIFAALQWFIYEPYTMENGIGVPEARLVPGIYASAAAPIGVFIFAWTARENVHWIVPTLGVVIYSTAQLILLNYIFVYLPTSYPRYAASLFAANGFFRSALACGAVHFSVPMFEHLGIGGGCSVLGGLTAGCFFGLVALWHFGPKLRARSKFAETY